MANINWHQSTFEDELLQSWLLDEGSLTRRLTNLSKDNFSVKPIQEGWQQLREDEQQALNCPANDTGWAREVFLCVDSVPVVFARSIARQEQLIQSGFDLQQLGNRSLGELLFTDRNFQRGSIETCSINSENIAAIVLPYRGQKALWARRSCFSKPDLDILVCEVFLPDLWLKLNRKDLAS